MKPDLSLFPSLSDEAKFPQWHQAFDAAAWGTNLGDVMDFGYNPTTAELPSYRNKCHWVYNILYNKVTTTEGRNILYKHRHTKDGKRVLHELIMQASRSTASSLRAQSIFGKLATTMLDSSWNRPYEDYISWFIRTCNTYNEMVHDSADRIHPRMIRTMLQRSVSKARALQAVHLRELESIARGQQPWSLEQYVALLKDAAATMDADRKTPSSRSRRGNEHSWDVPETDDGPDSGSDEGSSLEAFMSAMLTQQQVSSSMNRQTWNSLSDTTKKAWDTISPADKAKILSYAQDRAQRRGTDLQANVTELSDDANEAGTLTDTTASDTTASPSMEANAANSVPGTDADKGSVHPGDVRRMMGKKSSSRPTRAGNTVRWDLNTVRRSTTTPASEVWGGESGTTSSQLLPPSTSSSSDDLDLWGTSQPSSPDTFDLFGTVEHTAPSTSTFTTEKQNPFKPQYDPFSDIWADDEAQHFW